LSEKLERKLFDKTTLTSASHLGVSSMTSLEQPAKRKNDLFILLLGSSAADSNLDYGREQGDPMWSGWSGSHGIRARRYIRQGESISIQKKFNSSAMSNTD